jgi:bifunctional non-homologous end joining protein LigD
MRTQVGRRHVELSNLTKVLFPDDNIVKAQLIEYYFKIAPTILSHLRGRPLSLVRYPDGIGGESFYQKNRPGWAPDWIDHVTLGDEKKDYVIATEEASLVWLANLACVELHQMHSRAPNFDKPDYLVFDFDPPPGFKFARVAELALAFKEHLEGFGYHPFVKTTGRKGLHVLTPIEPRWRFDQAFEAAKAVAQPFVASNASWLTLQIRKDQRQGKVLLDVYRNRQSQTIVAAYSVRGVAGAPVSTPLHWEELSTLSGPGVFDLRRVPQRVIQSGDPWEGIAAYAAPIHLERNAGRPLNPRKAPRSRDGRTGAHAAARGKAGTAGASRPRTFKTPKQLEAYSRKRTLGKSPEPPPVVSSQGGQGNSFVVHRHHASRLHYDLRLEQNGILKSWAVPKGLPPRPGIKRLAVNVEDHPLAYVQFEGRIPRGEYGGGMMWRFARGRYEITRQKKDGMYFRLHSPELNGEFRVFPTKDNQWLLERLDTPQTNWLQDAIEPMLAQPANHPPVSPDYVYEVKWDGIRALITLDEGQVRIRSRNGTNITRQFPELLRAEQAFRATAALFDGEIICPDADGKPNFRNVIHRMQQSSETGIQRAMEKYPALCFVFDCLYLDGRAIVTEPLMRRREWLEDAIKQHSAYRLSELVDEAEPLLAAVRQMGLEGIMAKLRNSAYTPGTRNGAWLKIKTRQTIECAIIGYTLGKGDRGTSFGALHLASFRDGALRYVGKVGTGFDQRSIKTVRAELQKLKTTKRPVKLKPPPDARTVWCEPKLTCEVEFASTTEDGLLREPVFRRLRPDLQTGFFRPEGHGSR